MKAYTDDFKESIMYKLSAPNAMTVAEVSHEFGISKSVIHKWKRMYREGGHIVASHSKGSGKWSGQSKLQAIIETASLNEEETSEYCRRQGVYVEELHRWKDDFVRFGDTKGLGKDIHASHQKTSKRVKILEQELKRKEKALAEAGALLVLQKKARAIWGDDEDA